MTVLVQVYFFGSEGFFQGKKMKSFPQSGVLGAYRCFEIIKVKGEKGKKGKIRKRE